MKTYPIQTNTRTLLADLQTPVSLYLKVRDIYPESALLESSDFHGGENSFSYLGIQPAARFTVANGIATCQFPDGETKIIELNKSYSAPEALAGFIASFRLPDNCKPEEMNGLFGYTAYDAVRYFEKVETDNAETPISDLPDMLYIYYKYIIVFNHFKNELRIIENLFEGEETQLNQILSILENRNYASYNFSLCGEEHSFITDEDYKAMVRQGVKHCNRGDVFQIVLSRGYYQSFAGDDFKVYRALRSINPSPYLFYFDFGSFRIFGSSPETHCSISKGKATIDPIAGTFRRTGDDERDKILAEELLCDPKENAEHVMLVDLARNDLSRNAHDVKLDFYKEVQYYSHVIHLVSRVSGELEKDANTIRVFADTFPAGTLSGAPKVRAMQLIRDIEQHQRGAYGGCIGYIGLNGDVTQAITIRSFVSRNNILYYQAGAGIVSQSDDEKELQEVSNKLGALKKAIDLAGELIN